jgi:choline dehydrogenase-like flavoprotein
MRFARAGGDRLGGLFGSPQLLLLSGIGSAEDLVAHGIEVREELPVGSGLQDHLVVSGVWLTGESALLAGIDAREHGALPA